MIEFFLTMPISSSRPIIENTLSVFCAMNSATIAPASDSGRIVSTVTGWRNELNCDASTMYATRMPTTSANSRLVIASPNWELCPDSTSA